MSRQARREAARADTEVDTDLDQPRDARAPKAGPRTLRGQRTRRKLITAARVVFEREGYLDTRVSDISKEAGVAFGSFYTYFESKEAIFAELVAELEESMLHVHIDPHAEDILDAIAATNRAYLLEYRRNAGLMSLFEQVAQIDESFRELQRRRGMAFADRTARTIRRLQADGRADPSLDAYAAALAINGMTSRMAYQVYVLDIAMPFETMVETVTRMWVNALKLRAASTVSPED
jgi:AcrR family transcriptional regulator